MISIYDNYLEDNKDLIDAISNISEGKKHKLGPDEVLVVKGKKEEVIDVDDLRDYLKKGWEHVIHEATLTKNQQDMVKDIVDNDLDLEEFEKKYGKKEGKGVAFAVATNMVKKKEGITEEELNEVEYEYDGKVVKISKKNFSKVHKDYKNSTKGKERMMISNPKTGGVISVPVQFEEVELDEKKSATGYEIYHKSFSDAMQHAYEYAEKKGFPVDTSEIDDKVALGPKKPSKGKTNRYDLKAGRKTAHIQVYNMDNKSYELNMYIEGKNTESTTHLLGDSHWEASDELVKYLRTLTPGENPETELDEDAKMAKKSDDDLMAMLHQMLGQDQSLPSIQHQTKRIRKELKKRGLKEDFVELLEKAQKIFMFTTKKEAEQKAKEVKGKVLELKKAMDGNLFAVVVIGKGLTKEEVELAEEHGDNIEHFRDIVDNRQEKNVKFSDRTMKVDMWTASAIISVYDTVNKGNKERIAELANGSTKDLFRLQTVVTKLVSKSSSLRR